jgi:hypothetical protein
VCVQATKNKQTHQHTHTHTYTHTKKKYKRTQNKRTVKEKEKEEGEFKIATLSPIHPSTQGRSEIELFASKSSFIRACVDQAVI